MRKTTVFAVVATLVLGGLTASAWLAAKPPGHGGAVLAAHPVWTEMEWPFPIDQWGKGKAFQCKAVDCGTEVTLYLRAKIGFCNCATGVADDEELERVGDTGLIDGQFSALAPGRAIAVGWMKGRSRPYLVASSKSALAVAFNDRCDAVAATALVGHDRPTALEPAVLEFLNGKTVLRWAELALGL